MSTLAIPPKRVKLYRALWDRWIIVLRILLDLGAGAHPVRWQAVADTLLVDKKTCQKYMAGLVRDGHLALAGHGHMLTDAGMEFLRETDEGEIPHYLESGKNPGETFSPLKESVEVDSELKQLSTTSPTESGKIPGEIFSPDVRLALEQLSMLFDGSEITLNKLPQFLHIESVLGWIAYTYDKRARLHSPCGFIYSKLMDPSEPRPYVKYMQAPEEFLPDDYLDAIGRYQRTCPRCKVTFSNLAEDEAHQDGCLFKPQEPVTFDDSPYGTPDKTVSAEIEQAWQSVIRLLEEEMPRASFDTWVRDLVLVHAEEESIRVATRNGYARDWVSNRLTDRIEKVLHQETQHTLKVQFVVATETGA